MLLLLNKFIDKNQSSFMYIYKRMISSISILFFTSFIFSSGKVVAQENAAPSIHMSYFFPSVDAILKMQKIKIVQSAYASYFEVNWFTNGYAGLQQTPDVSYGNSNILISSLWDANTLAGIYSTALGSIWYV